MRSEQEVLTQLLDFAGQEPRIRIVLLNGSRVNPNVEKDDLRDYDVIFGVTDIAPYAKDLQWITRFGELIIMQHNLAEEDGEDWHIFLMLFADGVRIDLTFEKAERLVEPTDSLTQVLLDKDSIMGTVEPPSDRSYRTVKPSKEQYDDVLNEIWWCSTNVAKGLRRNELPYAKYMLDVVVKEALLTLLSWYVGLNSDWTSNTGKAGRWLRRDLPEEIWDGFVRTYAGSVMEDNWNALIATGEVTRSVGTAVASGLGYRYPYDEDRNVTKYINQLRRGVAEDGNTDAS